jgi:hypothetical protein
MRHEIDTAMKPIKLMQMNGYILLRIGSMRNLPFPKCLLNSHTLRKKLNDDRASTCVVNEGTLRSQVRSL